MTAGADDDALAELVDHITSRSDDTGPLANDVLTAFHRGLAVEKLVVLLRHHDPEVVGVGTWIAAELGAAAAPLVDEVPALLVSSSRDVRFYAIDVVLATAVGGTSDLAAHVLPLVHDADVAVRWKAAGFLARASVRQLRSALDVLTAATPADPDVSLLRWLLSAEGRDASSIRQRLASGDDRTRRYAVAAAARLMEVDGDPLRAAARATDDEVRRFAQDWLAIGGQSSPE